MQKYIILDCETTTMDTTVQEVDPRNQLVYDLGWVVVDANGKIYDKKSFVIQEVFLDEIINNAFYADKIPTYHEEIKKGERDLVPFFRARREFFQDCKKWEVFEVIAHNHYYDITALNNTIRYLTKSKYRYFYPFGIEISDTLKMARLTFGKTTEYKEYCHKNNYLTKRNALRFTAEILYRFISGQKDFEEEHTGLADCLIEAKIFEECLNINPKVKRNLFKNREVNFNKRFLQGKYK